jgi:hypothetical protein
MNRHVPHQNLFDHAKACDKWQAIVLVLATLSAIASITLNAIMKSDPAQDFNSKIEWIDGITSVLAVIYMILEILFNIKFFQAGKEKRIDMIDHGFDTNFSGELSTGYFNPGGINHGVYKLAVLGFENSLFTCNTAKKMTISKWIYAGIVLGIFLTSACFGEKILVNSIIQIAAAGILVQQAIKLQQFSDRIQIIHSDFKRLFNSLRDVTDKTSNEGEMVKNILNYETTLSWGGILLSDKIFFKNNDALSQKWEQMKQDYRI